MACRLPLSKAADAHLWTTAGRSPRSRVRSPCRWPEAAREGSRRNHGGGGVTWADRTGAHHGPTPRASSDATVAFWRARRRPHPSRPSVWPCSHQRRPPAASSWRPLTCRRDARCSRATSPSPRSHQGCSPPGRAAIPGTSSGGPWPRRCPAARRWPDIGSRTSPNGQCPRARCPCRFGSPMLGLPLSWPPDSAWTWSPHQGPVSTGRHRSPRPSWSPRTSSCWPSSPRIRSRAACSAASASNEDQSPLVMLAADRGAALAIAGAQGRASLGYLMHLGPG